ncbi:hypothetical protein LWC34_52545 [Kibdelosporangium philippinense]|uniref:Glycosyl hydrolases family 43 n=1 Tax=Kibdelosporangium philippinense TaxID=211113 RepID=A0ABS8ZUL1_9PSEU|nr:hypothetical protein [Kibdelosporangium philippinense]MCE7011386.1 hypothetical protein [Kibdelosporangium philippinense]
MTARVLWDMVDGPMPRGLLGVGDPDVHDIDGQWTMFLGGFSTRFRNRLYRAKLVEGAWVFDTDSRGRVAALAPDAPRGSWDAGGMHTPSYVPPAGGHGERIYYTGRLTSKHYGPKSRYSIGVLERRDGEWVRRDSPVIVGDSRRSSVLEPLVVYAEGRYRMWYQANPHEVGPGELPDYELRYTESSDGLTGWTPPAVFADSSEGFFDNTVVRRGDEWVMVLARGSNLHGTPDFPEQGLWWMTARHPSGRRSEWSAPQRLLDTDLPGTPSWFGHGTYGPSLAFEDPESATVFFSGTRRAPHWPVLALQRLLRLRRPPVPSPFFLATGSITVDPGVFQRKST